MNNGSKFLLYIKKTQNYALDLNSMKSLTKKRPFRIWSHYLADWKLLEENFREK